MKGDLLGINNTDGCAKYDGSYAGRAPLGMALQSGAVGETIAVLTQGWTNIIVADGAIASNGIPLKPAPTAGRVVAAADFSDGPIVGVSVTSAVNAGDVLNAHIRCGTWG